MNTPRYIGAILMALFLNSLALADEIWSFEEANNASLNKAVSDAGTPFANAASPIAFVYEGGLRFIHDGSTEHTFRQQSLSQGLVRTGIVEMAWTFSEIDFSRTVAAGGSANIGFDLRDLNGTRQVPQDDKVFGTLRLRCEKGALFLQYSQTANGGSNQWTSIASIEAAKLEEPLNIRMRFDLDRRSEPGAFQIFLKLGDEEEVLALENGTLPMDAGISGYRIIQQTLNGNNHWSVGDFVTVDNFSISYL